MRHWWLAATLAASSSTVFAGETHMAGYVEPLLSWEKGGGGSFFEGYGAFALKRSEDNGVNAFVFLPVQLAPAGAASNAWILAADIARAYVAFPAGQSYRIELGQFDKILGYEPNDRSERLTVSDGLLYSWLPKTHTGLLAFHDFSELLGVNFLFSNASDHGARSRASGPREPFDFGVQAVSRLERYQIKAGLLHSGAAGGATRTLCEMLGVSRLEGYVIAVDAVFSRYSSLDPGFGMGVYLTREWAEARQLTLRFEWLRTGSEEFPTSAASVARVSRKFASLSSSWKTGKALRLLAEYGLRGESRDGVSSALGQEFRIGALYPF